MTGRLYDTHFHLDLQKDRIAAISEIEENGIYTVAVTNLPDLYRRESGETASKFIRFGLGFHPELIHQYERQIPLMWELLPHASYIGEVGLDFTDATHKTKQVTFFTELIERCRDDRNKILTIHSRKAAQQVIDIIGKDYKFKTILHWFTGSKEELQDAIASGFYFSLNGAMMASKRFLAMLPLIPSERILVETDSPFTYFRGSHSSTLKAIETELKSKRPEVDLWENFKRLLGTI